MEFNRCRALEIEGRLISTDEASFTIEFTGSFCQDCGFSDYYMDPPILLE